MKSLIAILFFIGVVVHAPCYGQLLDTGLLKQKFRSHLDNNFQEKIYVHTDKNSYLAGEILWFKIYNVEAYTNRKVNVSKIAYVELLDAQNKPVLQVKVSLDNGTGSGSIYLPVSLQSGSFLLRVYTNWMKNFDVNYFFHKGLSIYNTVKVDSVPTEDPPMIASAIQFFPEGGNLVSGLTSKIGFRGVDHTGKGFDFTGFVLNDHNDTLAKFRPLKFGLGNFYFKPESGKNYRVIIQPRIGKVFYAELPQVFERGMVMQVKTQQDSMLNISIQSNLDQKGNFILFVHSGQKVISNYTINAQQSIPTVELPIEKLGDGISHFTLFNAAGQAVCERLYFKKPSALLKVSVSTDKVEYPKRAPVKISVSQTQHARPANSNFSVAVFKADASGYEEDIVTSLWLTSDLKGQIENASWYLSDSSTIATDNLMLTHGWRRFVWKDALSGEKRELEYLPEVQGPIVGGKVVNRLTQANLPGVNVFLSIPGRKFQFYTGVSKQDGRVHFYPREFYGSHEIIAQTDPRLDSLARIEIQTPYSEKIAEYDYPSFNKNLDTNSLLKRSIAMQVNNAFHSGSLNKEINLVKDSSFFYKKPDKRYQLDDYVRFTKMEEVLREYVSDINVTLRKKEFHLSVFDKGANNFFDSAPLMLIDGLPLFDEGKSIVGMDARNIKDLEIVTNNYGYGAHAFSGIVSLLTYNGNLSGVKVPAHAVVLDYDGIQNHKEFYAPMYEGDVSRRSRLADYRSTLLWSPENSTNNLGKETLDFYTSDLEGEYIVVVQSLSENGQAGHSSYSFKVSKDAATKL
ncbi:hypothetical protein D3C87_303790 [compost metagenome]